MDDRQKKKKKVYACSSLSLPLPVSFPHIQPPTGTGGGWCSLNTGNWLSPWSPVYFPLLPSPSLRPSPGTASLLPTAAGKPAAKHCSHGTFPAPMCLLQFALFYPALPCPVTAWGASSSWKGRLLKLLIQQCVSSLLLLSPLPFPPPQTFLQRLGLAAFLAGILGHPHERPPVWGEVARQLTGPKNSVPRRQDS